MESYTGDSKRMNNASSKIDLACWKLTLPIGEPLEIEPPDILDYASNAVLSEFMFTDTKDGSLVFYTYPGATTTNTSYSRTELREQRVPGSNDHNWTFKHGGRMRGEICVDDVSVEANGDTHRVIVMQIHGRLTAAQRKLLDKKDYDAPPVLMVFWKNGKVWVERKVLKDTTASDRDILAKAAWENEKQCFSQVVDSDRFTLDVRASEGRMQVVFNNSETIIFEDIHVRRWGIFDNYFKAGNYLTTRDEGAYSKVKFFSLSVSHT
jgi:hypothetical protein